MGAFRFFRSFFLLIIVLPFQACQSGGQEEKQAEITPAEPVYTGARLVQVDSIMIDLIGDFKVYDYQPETGLFLGGDIGPYMSIMGSSAPKNQIGHVVFNRQGEIIHQFNHADNGPEGHSAGAYAHTFLGPDAIGVLSRKALYRYGIDGTYRGKYTELNTTDMVGYSDQRSLYSGDGKHLIAGLAKGMIAARRAWDSLYQIVKPMWFYELDATSNSTLKKTHGFPDHPVYAPESEMNKTPYPPHMALHGKVNELITVYPQIPVARIYDMVSGEVKREFELSPEHFKVETPTGDATGGTLGYNKLLWLNRGGRMANAMYHEVVHLGAYSLFRYSPALPPSVVKELTNSNALLWKNEYWPGFRKKHYRFYYQLFKDGEKVMPDFELGLLEPQSGDLEMRSNKLTRGQIIGGNGLGEIFVFIPNDGEVERDYELIRVYKLELLSD